MLILAKSLILATTIVSIRPSVTHEKAFLYAEALVSAEKAYDVDATLIAAVIERASQWRSHLVNCNGYWWRGKKVVSIKGKALPVDDVVAKKLRCKKKDGSPSTVDVGMGQLNCPASGFCSAIPTDVELRMMTDPKIGIMLLAVFLKRAENRCDIIVKKRPRTEKADVCRKHWVGLMNPRIGLKVAKVILLIQSRILRHMKRHDPSLIVSRS